MKRPTSMLQEAVLLFLLTALVAGASVAFVHYVKGPLKKATKGVDSVPVSWEIHLKDGIKKYIESDSKVFEDRAVGAALDTIKSRLTAHEKDTTYTIEILVVESDAVNAVTFPGGLIVVFTPLMRLTSSPEELASVLAHEMGHVVHRDPVRQMAKEFGLSVVLSMVNGGKAPPMVETMVKDFLSIQYTREQESEADDYALNLLAQSGIDPVCFATFMQKLAPDASAVMNEKTVKFEYLNTHPDVYTRIGNANLASKKFDKKTEKRFSINWKLVKKRLPSVFD